MTKEKKLEWIKRIGFNVSTVDANTIRAQKYGLIVTGTIMQVYDELKTFKRRRRREDITVS